MADALEVKTGFGSIVAQGSQVFIVVALAMLAAASVWEHAKREKEHEELACLNKLAIFIQTIPRGSKLAWDEIPREYWPCLPQSVMDRRKGTE